MSITVVVLAIAGFGFRLYFSNASAPFPSRAGLCAFFALTLVGRSTGLGDSVATLTTFVDHSITVVVFAIAGFGLWFHFTDTGTPFSGCTRLFAGGTFTFVCAASFGDTIATLATFVDLTVAVVVLAIAGFGLWLGCIAGFKLAILTEHLSGTASCFAGLVLAFIDGAVAVVVFAVASFSLWLDFAYALAPRTRATCL